MTNQLIIGIILLLVLILVINLIIILIKKNIKKNKIKKLKKAKQSAKLLIENLEDEITRLKIISKTPEMKASYEEVAVNFKELKEDYQSIIADIDIIQDKEKLKQHERNFKEEYAILIEDVEDNINKLTEIENHIRKVTSYERNNQEILISLKEEYKKILNDWVSNEKLLEDYETAFNTKTLKIKSDFKNVEELMSGGEHGKARESLNLLEEDIDLINRNLRFYETTTEIIKKDLSERLNYITDALKEMISKNLKPSTYQFDQDIIIMHDKISSIHDDMMAISFNREIEYDIESKIREEIQNLETDLQKLENLFKIEYDAFKNIEKLINDTSVLIKNNEELLVAALEEQAEIKIKYNIDKIETISTLNEDNKKFKVFINDFTEIEKEYANGTEKYSVLYADFEKANDYAKRINNKILAVGKNFQNIRENEKKALENVDNYLNEITKIQVYLTYYNFNGFISNETSEYLTEIKEKIDILNSELNENNLNISRISSLNDAINNLLIDIKNKIKKEIEIVKITSDVILELNSMSRSREAANLSVQIEKMAINKNYRKLKESLEKLFKSLSQEKNIDMKEKFTSKNKILSVDEFFTIT